ncbi:methyltransferase domain-containing protein [Methanobacterium sp.]|uniref:50S ribosomal protein L11 methyltransferase n=1 Tax=Methanobacterium sp. TaxID=2164 RepID=UPI0025E18913|nr:methyltransferase domain-containing protein [Methanobacterium sp.]MBI5458590.1 50S ribosomal protein L11 methyltransferase [Methanobacterium sp.]
MKITSYQQNLLSDIERLTAFYEVITEKSKGIIYDLGTGSGVLSSWAAPLSRFVYAVEKDPFTAQIAQKNLRLFKNVSLMVSDAKTIFFPEKADIIICEMMDTALIDEDQVPVLNSVQKYLKKDGDIIPCGVFNGVEAVDANIAHLCYHEGVTPQHQLMSKLIIYDKIDFKKYINPKIHYSIPIPINNKGTVSGVKITTFTLLTPNFICGPTPMLNPPLLVPTNKLDVEKGDEIILKLKYSMGGGLDTLRASIEPVS